MASYRSRKKPIKEKTMWEEEDETDEFEDFEP